MCLDRRRQVIFLAFPIILSQGIQTILLLTDRYILSLKDPFFNTIATTAGFTALSINAFFSYYLAFSITLVGKSFGKGDITSCHKQLSQCFLFSTFCIPILLCCSFLGKYYFIWLQHPLEFQESEYSYFSIIILSYIPILYKTSLESYLIGIGKSKQIFYANIIGFLINTLFCYLFVIGCWKHIFIAANGAAYASVVANICATIFLMLISRWKLYTNSLLKDSKTFLVQGFFTGLEKFVNSFCFVLFVNMLVVYGKEQSTAVSIVFSWDQIAFLPLMGIYGALMSLYSRYLGQNDRSGADKILHSTLFMTLIFMGCLSVIFWSTSEYLIAFFFQSKTTEIDALLVKEIGTKLFYTTGFYIIVQSFVFIYKAALRSLGLASWCFRYSMLIHLLLITSSYLGIYVFHVNLFQAWSYFMMMLVILALTFIIKFYSHRKMLPTQTMASSP